MTSEKKQEVKRLELLLDEKIENKAEIFDGLTPAKARDLLTHILRRNLLKPIAEKIAEEPKKYFSKADWKDILPDLKGNEKDKMKHIAYCVASCRLLEAFYQKSNNMKSYIRIMTAQICRVQLIRKYQII